MYVDLHNLRAWHDKHGSQFAQKWKENLEEADNKEALIVDRSRRRVTSFFGNIAYLHNARLVPERTEKLLTDFAGNDLFYSVVEPLGRALSADYDKTPFDILRSLRPPRAGLEQFVATNWVIRDP